MDTAVSTPRKLTYFGKDVEDLTREELIEALHAAADLNEQMRADRARHAEMTRLLNGRRPSPPPPQQRRVELVGELVGRVR